MFASTSSRLPFNHRNRVPLSTSFATSNARSEPQFELSQLSEKHYSSASDRSYATMPQSLYPLQGIIRQGHRAVLTRAYPDVQACLDYAETQWKLPTLSEDVFTLSAEQAYFNPSCAAHWLFWGNERQRKESLSVMRRVCLHQPPLVVCSPMWLNSSVTSLDIILLRRRNVSMHRQLQYKPWFSRLALPNLPVLDEQPADQGRVLRKRKPQASPVPTECVSEEPLPKRAKTTPNHYAPPAAPSPVASSTPRPESVPPAQRARHNEFKSTHKLIRSVSHSSAETLVDSDDYRSLSVETVCGIFEDKEAEKDKLDHFIDAEAADAESEESHIMTRARRRAADLVASKAAKGFGRKTRKRRNLRKT